MPVERPVVVDAVHLGTWLAERVVRAPRSRPATIEISGRWDHIPPPSALAQQVADGRFARIVVREPVRFDQPSGAHAVRALAFVRECASVGASVSWSAVVNASRAELIPRIDHLPAPARIAWVGPASGDKPNWRSHRRFGLFYFRRGPGFRMIIDRRPESSCRIVIDEAVMADTFDRALDGIAWASLVTGPDAEAAASDLVREGLILRMGDHCVSLPIHMRSWPIPALDV